MASNTAVLPPLTTAEYKEIYSIFLARCDGREQTIKYMSKYLPEMPTLEQKGLRVLVIGPGTGDFELRLLASHPIADLTAVESSLEMADVLEANIRSSSISIAAWNIHRTNVESYVIDKTKDDGPFDLILMVHSLYYVGSRGSVLCHLRSLLRPHIGRLIIVVTVGCIDQLSRNYASDGLWLRFSCQVMQLMVARTLQHK
jgi:hypothetical protein